MAVLAICMKISVTTQPQQWGTNTTATTITTVTTFTMAITSTYLGTSAPDTIKAKWVINMSSSPLTHTLLKESTLLL